MVRQTKEDELCSIAKKRPKPSTLEGIQPKYEMCFQVQTAADLESVMKNHF